MAQTVWQVAAFNAMPAQCFAVCFVLLSNCSLPSVSGAYSLIFIVVLSRGR